MDVLASTLKSGDVVDFYGRGNAVILRDLEEDTNEFFGRSGFFKFWARQVGTETEGWLKFGPTGHITRLEV